ncbi:hypothetical protein ES703_108567 [subsurface metagenome]
MSGKSCRILMVVLAVLSLAGLAACRKSDNEAIQDTIVEFYDAYLIEDFTSCLEMFSTRLRANEGDENLVNRMESIETVIVPILVNELGEPLVTGETATIWVTFFSPWGLTQPIRHTLVKEGGKWKVDEELPSSEVIALFVPMTGRYDVSRCPREGYIEFRLAVGETLAGRLSVETGSVVFVVTDYWNNHIYDLIVKEGETYSFSITAKQSGERYRCWFTYESGKANDPREATFLCNMVGKGWR